MFSTFDLFDTIIVRLVAMPCDVFRLVGKRLKSLGVLDISESEFRNLRVNAEDSVRTLAGVREITLKEIYNEIEFRLSIQGNSELMQRVEIETELSVWRLVPSALTRIKSLRLTGARIGFISDMYLPEREIRLFLENHNVLLGSDTLWISSSSGATKRSGQLFHQIQKETGVAWAHWNHIGDNPHADVEVPRQLGIRAELFSACSLNQHELWMNSLPNQDRLAIAQMTGVSRWCRLSSSSETEDAAVQLKIARESVAPILYAFVRWTLEEAFNLGIKKIWFVARDGQIMMKIASDMIKKFNLEMEVGYLYATRQLLHLASIETVDDRAMNWITGGAGIMQISGILRRIGLTIEEVRHELDKHQIPVSGPIGWENIDRLKRLIQDSTVALKIQKKAAQSKEQMLRYYEQCGLMGTEKFVVVDIGWRGNVLRSLTEIIGFKSAVRHNYLYFGLYGRPPELKDLSMKGYLFDESTKERFGLGQDLKWMTLFMEIFCQADHGPVVGFTESDGRFEAVLGQESNQDPSWNVHRLHRCIQEFCNEALVTESISTHHDLRSLCFQLLSRLILQPTFDEAEELGKISFADDQAGLYSQVIAEPYRLSHARKAFRAGEYPQINLNWWTPGALRQTPRTVRWALRIAIQAKQMLGSRA